MVDEAAAVVIKGPEREELEVEVIVDFGLEDTVVNTEDEIEAVTEVFCSVKDVDKDTV